MDLGECGFGEELGRAGGGNCKQNINQNTFYEKIHFQ